MQTSELKTQFFRRPSTNRHLVTEAPTPAQGHTLPDTPTQLWFPAAAAQPQARQQTVQPKRPYFKYLFLGFTLLALLAVGFTAVAGASLLYLSDLILPGVQVMGVDVGRLNQVEAAEALQNAANQQTLRLVNDETVWLVSPVDLGLTLDAAATAEKARAYGRTPAAWGEFIKTGAITVEPSWVLDTAVAQTYLQNRAAELGTEPVNAGLVT